MTGSSRPISGTMASRLLSLINSGVQASVAALVLILGACSVSTNTRVTEDTPIWGRADCQRGEGNPELQSEFDEAKATCLARGETAAAVAGSAGSNPCMNEQRYVLRTRAEHAAACQGTQEQKGKPATTTKKPASKSKSAGPPSTPEHLALRLKGSETPR